MPYCLIIGPGAVGTAISYYISKLEFNVGLIGKSGLLANYNANISINNKDQKISIVNKNIFSKVDVIFITVKAYDIKNAIDSILPQINSGCLIIILSNGYLENIISKYNAQYPEFNWALGAVTLGISRIDNSSFKICSKNGRIIWGPYKKKKILPIEKSIINNNQNVIFQWNDNIFPIIRKKWLFNVIINSLSAARGFKKNIELLNDVPTLNLIFNEALDLYQKMFPPITNKDLIYHELIALIKDTGENENSMLADLRLKRKTESDFLAGLSLNYNGFNNLKKLHNKITNFHNDIINF